MSAINWSELAAQCGPSIGSQYRGVQKISRLGYHVLFVPSAERSRVEIELANACLPIHGFAIWTREDGERFFLAVVKAGNADELRAIAHGKGTSEAGSIER
jgi:hypothetical protein